MTRIMTHNKIIINKALKLASGEEIANFEIAYNAYGTLNAAKDNVILIMHALTGDQYVPDGRVAVAVDCADASRIGPDLLDKFGGQLWGNIDHHASNPGYARHNIVVKTAAATCHVLAYGALRQNLGCDAATAKAGF